MSEIGIIVLGVAVVLALVLGLVHRSTRGRMRARSSSVHLGADDLGTPLGERATLVQFSSAFCAPCRATRARLEPWAAETEGLTYVDVDAESQLDLVRRLNIMRTPTVLVVDPKGQVVAGGSGGITNRDELRRLQAAVQPLL